MPDALLRRRRSRRQLRKAAARADSFLASFPKSGRTWLRFMISNYLNEAYGLGRTIDLQNTFAFAPNFDLSRKRGLPAFDGNPSAAGLPAVFVTHLSHDASLFGDAPVIFLLRDPREVMVSGYHHAVRHKKNFSGGVSDFIDRGDYGLRAYIGYHNAWAAALRSDRDLVLTYRELSDDAGATLQKIIARRGWRMDAESVAKAVELSAFERMRQAEAETGIPDHDYDRSDEDSRRMRRGEAGAFREDLTDAEIDQINQRLYRDLNDAARRLVEKAGDF